MKCTFFGHRHISDKIQPVLRKTIINLIENKKVDLFYVGNQGGFDVIVKKTLAELKKIYSHIDFFVVLAYMPSKNDAKHPELFHNTIYPDGMETVPPKFAISRRNI